MYYWYYILIGINSQGGFYQRCGCRDGRDDFSRDLPGAVHVRLGDLVDACPEVGRRRDELHVIV